MLVDIGVGLLALGLGIAGAFGSSNAPFEAAGWLALIFALLCWYVATAQLVNAAYGKAICQYGEGLERGIYCLTPLLKGSFNSRFS